MNLMILSDCDKPNSAAFEAAVLGSGVTVDDTFTAFTGPGDAMTLHAYGIRALPCMARIVGGVAIHQETNAFMLGGFDAAADAAQAGL